jgi:hypothetical protein
MVVEKSSKAAVYTPSMTRRPLNLGVKHHDRDYIVENREI